MWKIVLLMAVISLASCKSPNPKPLGEVDDQNINIGFRIDSAIAKDSSSSDTFTMDLDLRNDKGDYIDVGSSDQMHLFLNDVEYQLVKIYCSDLYGSQYLCGYRFPSWSLGPITKLAQPLNISFELRRSKGQLITAKASLPPFVILSSSLSADKKYNPLTDLVQINWVSSVPLKHILYSAGQYEHSVCFSAKTIVPQKGDTYTQLAANAFGLDTTICNPMSYAIVTAAIDNVTTLQTNVKLASATVQLKQTTSLTLLSEPISP